MKKIKPFGELFYGSLKKTILIMRIAFVLLILGILQTYATDAYSQKTRLSLNFSDVQLIEVLDNIEDQSEFYFLYNEKLLNTNRIVNISAKNQLITKILDNLFDNTDIEYSIIDRKIILAPEYLFNENSTEEPPQQQYVTGTVTDLSTGQPMPGVNVLVKGTNAGALSDANGKYSVPITDPKNAILVFSFIGYGSKEVAVLGQTVINTSLEASVTGLNEVVVIGYGTVLKKDLTGSVSSVTASELQDLPSALIDQSMLGKLAGVQVKSVTGEPGAGLMIRVRGIGSISAGVDPLFVVDGFPVDDIQMLNPNDVESIDVLKDASATAIYGSRGSNGVVIITTKRGTKGNNRFSFDAYYGFQKVEKIPKMKHSLDQAYWFLDGMRNRNLDRGQDVSGYPTTWAQPVPQRIMDIVEGKNTIDVEPLDYIFQTAPQKNIQLSATGGTDNLKYIVSADYLDQDGIVVNSNYNRYSIRTNIDVNLTKELSLSVNLNPSFSQQKTLPVTGEGCCLGSNIVAAALQIHNFIPMLDENGDYASFGGLADLAAVYNPLAVAKETKTDLKRFNLLGNINIDYEILDGLIFRIMTGARIDASKGMRFRPTLAVFFNEPPTGYDYATMGYNWITEYTLNYNKTFGLHSITGLAGYTVQTQKGYSNSLESNLYPNNLVPTLNAASGITSGSSGIGAWSLISYLARANYVYSGKYYFTASVRADGSSRFGTNNKYAVFPSFALAWRISEENFLKNISFLSDLKLRGSWGQSGNNSIGNYEQYATIAYQLYPFGGIPASGFVPAQLANPYLTWEKQKQLNLGVDIGLFKGRINLNIDNFNSTNSDLLLDVNVPGITGFTTTLQNIGEVKNKGWEFVVRSKNLVGKFVWTTDFNISTYKNKVTKLGPSGDPIYSGNNVTMIGQPLGMFYGYLVDGVFMNQAELDKGPIYNPGASDRSRVGDIRFVDVSGPDGVPDGKIDNTDNTIMGNPYPDFYYGMTNQFSYQNFMLTVSLQGSQGNEVLCRTRDAGNSGRSRVRGYAFTNNYWKSEAEPGDGKTPRPNDSPTGGPRRPNQNWVDNGSFLRITNITFSYTLPEQISNKISFDGLRFYVTATNPFLFTKYVSFNPDVSFRSGNPLRPGNEANDYPLGKGLIFGLNASF